VAAELLSDEVRSVWPSLLVEVASELAASVLFLETKEAASVLFFATMLAALVARLVVAPAADQNPPERLANTSSTLTPPPTP